MQSNNNCYIAKNEFFVKMATIEKTRGCATIVCWSFWLTESKNVQSYIFINLVKGAICKIFIVKQSHNSLMLPLCWKEGYI